MSAMVDDEQLLTVKKCAGRFGVSVRTVWRIIAAGELPVVRIRGCTRIPEAALLAYEERHRQGGQR